MTRIFKREYGKGAVYCVTPLIYGYLLVVPSAYARNVSF
jgi:hypothetical protein